MFDLGIENEGSPPYPRVRRQRTPKEPYLGIIGTANRARDLALEREAYKIAELLLTNAKEGREFCFNEVVQACINESYPMPLRIFVESPRISQDKKAAVHRILNKKKNWNHVPESMKNGSRMSVPLRKERAQKPNHMANPKVRVH